MLFWIRKRPARWAEAKRVHKSGQTKCLRLIKYKHNLHKHVVIVTDSKVWDCVETSDNNDIIICRTELRALKLASILWLENAQSLSSSTCGLSIYCTPLESSISLFMSTPPWVFWHGCFSSRGSIIDSTKQCHILIWIDRSLPLRVHAGYESGMHLPRSRTQHRWLDWKWQGEKYDFSIFFRYSPYFGDNLGLKLHFDETFQIPGAANFQNGWLETATSPPQPKEKRAL